MTYFRCTILIAVAALSMADVPSVSPFFPPTPSAPQQSPSLSPAQSAAADSRPDSQNPAGDPAPARTGNPSQPMKPETRVEILRYVDGEFAKAAKPLPGKTNGFTLHVGRPIEDQAYQDALRLQGTAISAGDPVQITRVDFEGHKIILQVNGGAKKKFHLRDHLQIGVSAGGEMTGTDGTANNRQEGLGAVIVLDYGKPVPDVSPADIKLALAPLLDFSKQPSAAVNWVETLPQKFQDAIRDHKALPGMDQQMVLAAIGHPDKKVREKDAAGIDTEDWIYGNPPAKTVFVTFVGDTVSRVEEFN